MMIILETQDIQVKLSFFGRRCGIVKVLLLCPTLILLTLGMTGHRVFDFLETSLCIISYLPCQYLALYLPIILLFFPAKVLWPQASLVRVEPNMINLLQCLSAL